MSNLIQMTNRFSATNANLSNTACDNRGGIITQDEITALFGQDLAQIPRLRSIDEGKSPARDLMQTARRNRVKALAHLASRPQSTREGRMDQDRIQVPAFVSSRRTADADNSVLSLPIAA